ncbi:hypothetical protein NP233_g1971 [Leucocoprinus birnbaumii]|uniref:Nephrocystin 3-like N-terminal domain-containing protein n=1 Tax=Leucocoprinus birnbaumii TaxID=56174 RepID=A0AAD5VZ35_9AGAR|nr:hypothetical protein NP233_g1971 [Leucocoprinus birnbaumii]
MVIHMDVYGGLSYSIGDPLPDNGTELFSQRRWPFPRCLEGTCEDLIKEILSVSGTGANIQWITGPPGSGKSALAQTIGEKGCLAAFFFSRSLDCVDPSRLWFRISTQLEDHMESWSFHRHTAPSLGPFMNSPTVLASSSNLKRGFGEYIQSPALYITHFPEGFIIIDGLDECRSESEQAEIVGCILDSTRQSTGLRWMIFSRPESHLRAAFEKAQDEGICWIKEIRVDAPEMQRDVKEYLEKEFKRITMTFIITNGEVQGQDHWPSEEVMMKLLKAVSGLFIYAVTIIKFIGDPLAADPVGRLQMVIEIIDGAPLREGAINPIGAIDTLYRTLIERTPDDLPLTLDVLGTLIVCPPLPPLHLAHLLEVDTIHVMNALLSLHSVVAVPSWSKMSQTALHYYHASFADFLINPSRAGNLFRDPTHYRNQLAVAFVRILSNNAETLQSEHWRAQVPGELDIEPPLSVFSHLVHIACQHLWQICVQATKPENPFLERFQGSEPFKFVRLRNFSGMIPTESFLRFLRCLRRSTRNIQQLKNLVRTTCSSTGPDLQLIDACRDISQPLDLERDELPG